jgi:putative FmdB family regulatory protein
VPTYQYHCRACGHSFELRESIASTPGLSPCPKCGSLDTERVVSGFYARTPRKS